MSGNLPKKILIANRGEIAIKIAKSCDSLGIETHGIYTKEDEYALHINLIDLFTF